jgi:hypothetical protein
MNHPSACAAKTSLAFVCSLVLGLLPSLAAAQVTAVPYPALGGSSFTSVGSDINGGETLTYTLNNPSAASAQYYVIGDYPPPSYNWAAQGPSLSMNGATPAPMTFDAGASNLAGGIAVYTGTTTITGYAPGDYSGTVDTEFVLKVTNASNGNPLALVSAGSVSGIPSILGAALNVSSLTSFDANWSFLAKAPSAGSYVSAAGFYNGDNTGGMLLFDSVGGAFYAAAVPEPETYALMLAGLSLLGVVSLRRGSQLP